jgi:hypothetical protein
MPPAQGIVPTNRLWIARLQTTSKRCCMADHPLGSLLRDHQAAVWWVQLESRVRDVILVQKLRRVYINITRSIRAATCFSSGNWPNSHGNTTRGSPFSSQTPKDQEDEVAGYDSGNGMCIVEATANFRPIFQGKWRW